MIPVEIADDVRRMEVMMGSASSRGAEVKASGPAIKPEVVVETYVVTETGQMRVESGRSQPST